MIRTFNRMPASVNVPSKKDVKQYFFNNYKWNGVINNKNFVDVDQESFEDCNNVYVSSDGLLRSRPSMKKQEIVIDGVTQHLSYIVDVWQFGDVTVYRSSDDYLTFVEDGQGYQTASPLTFKTGDTDKRVKLVVADRKIFIFTSNMFYCYNMNNHTISNAESFIYIPTTKIVTNGITTTTNESVNILNKGEYTQYIYDNASKIVFNDFLGKTVIITLDGKDYTVTYTKDTPLIIMNKYCPINSGFTYTERFDGTTYYSRPRISISDIGSCILTKVSGSYPNYSRLYYYSVDGLVFEQLPELPGATSECHITRNGYYAVATANDGVYVTSVVATESNEQGIKINKYNGWVNLADYLELSITVNISVLAHLSVYDDTNLSVLYSASDGYHLLTFWNEKVENKIVFDYTPMIVGDASSYQSLFYEPNIRTFLNKTEFVTTLDFTTHYTESGSYGGSNKLYNYHVYFYKNDTSSSVVNKLLDKVPITIGSLDFARINWFNSSCYKLVVDNNTETRTLYHIYRQTEEGTNIIKKYSFDASYSLISTNDISYTENLIGNEFLYNDEYTYLLTEYGAYNLESNSFTQYISGSYTSGQPVKIIGTTIYNWGRGFIMTNNSSTQKIYIKMLSVAVSTNYLVPEYEAEIDNYFISIGKTLYISENVYDSSNNFLWYFPKINIEEFDYKITNLHAISSSEIAIFMNDSIYYATYDKDVPGYRYYKSKVQVGLADGSDVITTFDGKYTIFASERGIVALSYQDFIASTEQSLTYISDNVYDNFYDYLHTTNNVVKLYKFAYWIICYSNEVNNGFVLDTRNMSWWPVSCLKLPTKFIDIHNEVKLLADGSILDLDTNDTNYYDFYGEHDENEDEIRHKIDWFLTSQKLYLSAINYYKHITNMTFTSVHDLDNLTDNDYNIDELDFRLEIFNYRKKVDSNVSYNNDFPIVNYQVNMARTFVQRLNFGKVNEFQYRMSFDNDIDAIIQIPLSLNSITVKYKIGDMVR